MKYEKQNAIILNKKLVDITKIYGNETKTFVIANNIGYTLKKILYSNTQLIVENSRISDANGYYDVQETKIDYEHMNGYLQTTAYRKSSFDDFVDVKSSKENDDTKECKQLANSHKGMTYIDMSQLSYNFGFGNKQAEEIIYKFCLTHVTGDFYVRFEYGTLRHIFTYFYINNTIGKDEREFSKMYSREILAFCNGKRCVEWCVAFILLDLHEKGMTNEFCKTLEMLNILEYSKVKLIDIVQMLHIKNYADITKELDNICITL